MRVLWAFADVQERLNSSKWRIIIPSEALKRAGHRVELINMPQLDAGTHHFRPQDFDIVVAERELFRNPERILKWQEHVPILASFDDAYHLIPASVITSRVWKQGKVKDDEGERPIITQFKKLLRQLDGYITPSELLTSDYLTINPHGYTIPNYPDLNWDCWKAPRREPDGQIKLVWGGSLTHYNSWRYSGIVSALNRIFDEYDNVSLTLVTQDLRIPALFAGQPPNKVRYHKGVEFEEWPRLLAQFDIGLAPLHGEYDRRRSWIKVLEYCLVGLMPIVSGYEPYLKTRGVTVAKPKNWWKAIKIAIDTHQMWRDSEGPRNDRIWALKQGIDGHTQEYIDAFNDAIERKQNG